MVEHFAAVLTSLRFGNEERIHLLSHVSDRKTLAHALFYKFCTVHTFTCTHTTRTETPMLTYAHDTPAEAPPNGLQSQKAVYRTHIYYCTQATQIFIAFVRHVHEK